MLATLRLTLLAVILAGAILAVAAAVPGWLLARRYAPSIYEIDQAPERSVAIVFGAGIRYDGRPTRVLEDRVRTAVELYHAGTVRQILLSGGTQRNGHHETDTMLELARQLGVPPGDILLDHGGIRTFETCARASEMHSVQDALLVTQRFHLPRALLICDTLGMQADGVAADQRIYSRFSMTVWKLREIPATLRALWDLGIHERGVPSPPPIREAENHES